MVFPDSEIIQGFENSMVTPQEQGNRANSNGCLVSEALYEAGKTGFSPFSQGLLLLSIWGPHCFGLWPPETSRGPRKAGTVNIATPATSSFFYAQLI